MTLEWITLIATAVAGYAGAPRAVILLAALALMLEPVWGKAWHLRQHPRVPLTTKMLTYLVSGAVVALLAAWLAFIVGAFLGTLLPDQRISSFMAPSRPSMVSGNMRPPMMSPMSLMEGVQLQWFSGTGLSHTACS